MAKGRAKARGKSKPVRGKKKPARSKSKPAPQASRLPATALAVLLLLGAALAAYWSFGQIFPEAPASLPQAQALSRETLAHLRGLPRLKSLQLEEPEPATQLAGPTLASLSISFDSEAEIILAEQAIEDFWKSRDPALEVDVAYPEDAAGGSVLLSANRQGAPGLEVRLFRREPEQPAPVEPLAQASVNHGRIAVVIDDIGNSLGAAEKLAALPEAVTLAVIPFTPFAQTAERVLARAGKEIILHLPMEPQDYPGQEPGTGAIFLDMSPQEIENALIAALAEVPQAACVNNHMGSALTEDPPAMAAVMRVLQHRGLCFLDSRTSPHSVALAQAEEFGVARARRDVFLDNDRSPFAIRRRLLELSRIAHAHGRAVGIGHPYPETIQVLAETLPKLESLGYEIVPLSQLAVGP